MHRLRLLEPVGRVQRRSPVGLRVANHRHRCILALAAGRRLFGMQHPLRFAALAADHGNRVGR